MNSPKEDAFNKVIKWLREFSFGIENEKRLTDPNSQITFYCEVKPYEKREDFFKIIIPKQFEDCFLLEGTIILDTNITESLNATRWKEQQQLFIDFRKAVHPLGINFESKKGPNGQAIILNKIIFFDSLNSKQYFIDSVFNMINALLLVSGVLDEFRNAVFPKGNN